MPDPIRPPSSGVTISLSPEGSLLLHLSLRDGSPYPIVLPAGKAELVLRDILEQQSAGKAEIGQRAGATVFAIRGLLEALGGSFAVTSVKEGKRSLGLATQKTALELGL